MFDAGIGRVEGVEGGRAKLAVDRRGLDWIGLVVGSSDQCLGGEAVRARRGNDEVGRGDLVSAAGVIGR
jgi:hypothetical protein